MRTLWTVNALELSHSTSRHCGKRLRLSACARSRADERRLRRAWKTRTHSESRRSFAWERQMIRPRALTGVSGNRNEAPFPPPPPLPLAPELDSPGLFLAACASLANRLNAAHCAKVSASELHGLQLRERERRETDGPLACAPRASLPTDKRSSSSSQLYKPCNATTSPPPLHRSTRWHQTRTVQARRRRRESTRCSASGARRC